MKQNCFLLSICFLLLEISVFAQGIEQPFQPVGPLHANPVSLERGGGDGLLLAERHTGWVLSDQTSWSVDSTAYTYDQGKNRILSKEMYFDLSLNAWRNISQAIEGPYDSDGNNTYARYQYWEGVDWKNERQYHYYFGSLGRLDSLRDEYWSTDHWVLYNLEKYTYDQEGKLIQKTDFFNLYDYEYDLNGNLLVETRQVKQLGNWQNRFRTMYSYNAQQQVSSFTLEEWNNNWNYQNRYSYVYDNNGNRISFLTQAWDGGSFKNKYLHQYTYDAQQNMVGLLNQIWEGNAWVNLFKEDRSFDSFQNLVFEHGSQWFGPVNGWGNSTEHFYTYDADQNLTHLLLKLWNDSQWKLYTLDEYFYAPLSGIKNQDPVQFDFYPNPANTTLNLQGEQLLHARLFDGMGRMVLATDLQDANQAMLRIGHLPAGNYLLQVLDSSGKTGAKPLQIRR
jgi:YD repeat-containing protein